MLVSYTISNFKSIKHPERINFKARPYKCKIGAIDDKFLSVIGLYGPNGGGKSSIIDSVRVILDILRFNNNVNELNRLFIAIDSCKNKNNLSEPITWEFVILSKSKKYYRYKISFNNFEIEGEQLEMFESEDSKKKELIFTRHKQNFELGKSFQNIKLKQIGIGSLLSYLYTNIENEYISEFYNEILKISVYKSIHNHPVSFNPLFVSLIYNLNWQALQNEKDKFKKLFKDLDINIVDYKIVKDNIVGQDRLILVKKNDLSFYELDFIDESDGTKKIIQLMSYFIAGLHNGNTYFIDELDSQLHTKLLGYIIDMFHSKLNANSQLIFSSHDMNTLDSQYLRKDEVYFVGLNESYFTNCICLSNFSEVRENSSYSKKYLNGEFGYDPYVTKCKGWKDE